jgi:large repetitive protein
MQPGDHLPRPRQLLVPVVLLVMGCCVAVGAGPAFASHVSCGDTITADTTLDSDLVNCPNNGIVIGADDVTLDLNGHTIDGDGELQEDCPEGAFCDVGIDNTAGHTGVTIKRGAIRDFDVGIFIVGASENRIQRLSSADNSSFGVIVGDSSESRIDHCSSVGDGVSGILMFDSRDNRIDHNSVTGAHGYAIPVFGSSDNRVEKNTLDGNDHGILLDSSNDNDVKGNRISHSGGSSIDLGHATGNRVEENVLRDNGDGVIVADGQGNLVSGNSVTGTGFFGFPDTGGFGVVIDGGSDNLVQRNAVTGGRGPAIFVTQLEAPAAPDRSVVSHNVANSKVSDGILVNGDATATLLERNTADGNGDDGIDVDAAGTTVTANTANHNQDLGIEAVFGVIDGGGNKASGNGNPAQCTNVTCK